MSAILPRLFEAILLLEFQASKISSILSTGETLFLLSRSFDFDFFFDLSRDFDLFFLNFLSFERDRLRSRDLDGFDVLDRFVERLLDLFFCHVSVFSSGNASSIFSSFSFDLFRDFLSALDAKTHSSFFRRRRLLARSSRELFLQA
jgi:hypothetical protein